MSVADIRRSYDWGALHDDALNDSPFVQLGIWIDDAVKAGAIDPTAMTLATVNTDGQPSARIVLLKGYDDQGLVFYTNYTSRKGLELAGNDNASVLFYWPGFERQIRVEGTIRKATDAQSDAYYHSRPLSSRISAWASPQSQPITRDELETRMAQYSASLGEHPERPGFWGGYRLEPRYFEFWQGRTSRLHDRLVYKLGNAGQWVRSRLAP